MCMLVGTDELWSYIVDHSTVNNYIEMFDDETQRTMEAMRAEMQPGKYEPGDVVEIKVTNEQLDSIRKYKTMEKPWRNRPAVVLDTYEHHGNRAPYYTVLVGTERVRVPECYLAPCTTH